MKRPMLGGTCATRSNLWQLWWCVMPGNMGCIKNWSTFVFAALMAGILLAAGQTDEGNEILISNGDLHINLAEEGKKVRLCSSCLSWSFCDYFSPFYTFLSFFALGA
jgi:hypothetical protein